MQQPLLIEVSAGELIDKITILEIKAERIRDAGKLRNVQSELESLRHCRSASLESTDQMSALAGELKKVNERLWEIEDSIRHCERSAQFGEEFIELARSVYKQNDRRAALKRQINDLAGSRIVEEKSYSEY